MSVSSALLESLMNRRRFLSTSITAFSAHYLALDTVSEAANGNAALDPSLRSRAVASLENGLAFLKKVQKPEGFWSTADYPGLTSLVIQAFVGPPDGKHRNSSAVHRGLKFIRKSAKPDGGIYNKGLSNYNTSIAVATLILASDQTDKTLIEAGRKFLIGAQRKNSSPSSNDGGFGYEAGGSGNQSRPDLDNTVFTLEAFALYREANRGIESPGRRI
jgi:squalene-hopene/tetraprenyl-beta-curcumene cyclase